MKIIAAIYFKSLPATNTTSRSDQDINVKSLVTRKVHAAMPRDNGLIVTIGRQKNSIRICADFCEQSIDSRQLVS